MEKEEEEELSRKCLMTGMQCERKCKRKPEPKIIMAVIAVRSTKQTSRSPGQLTRTKRSLVVTKIYTSSKLHYGGTVGMSAKTKFETIILQSYFTKSISYDLDVFFKAMFYILG